MASKKYKDTLLWVRALDNADVREIDENGKPLVSTRLVGKDNHAVMSAGVQIPYHSHYISKIKEGSLIPMDIGTAMLAGVIWQPLN